MQNELDRQLAALRVSVASLDPPERVDRAIADAVEHNAGGRRARRAWRLAQPAWLTASVALAATVAFVAIVGRDAMRTPALDANPPPAAADSDRLWFLPVVPVAELAKTEDALVVSAQLSRITLAQLGLPIDPALAADVVDTELLVRPDGGLLAVRFVH
jgi:hypothetical protein